MGAGADEVARRAAGRWSRRPPSDGFRLDGVRALEHAVEVAFRWRRDPQPYLVRLPHPGLAREVLGDDFSADGAVAEMGLRLMEELDTGLVSSAERVRVGDAVLLGARPPGHDGWFVGEVPLTASRSAVREARAIARASGRRHVVVASASDDLEPVEDPGRFLDEQGLDGAAGRSAVLRGDLIAWLQVDRGRLGDDRAGQAVVVRTGPAAAEIVRLDVLDPQAFVPLAWAACRRAVESGAAVILAPGDEGPLEALGFRERDGRLVARHDELRRRRAGGSGADGRAGLGGAGS